MRRPWIGAQWLFGRTGPAATNHFETGGFVRSNETVAYPNLMFHFLPVAIRYDGTPVMMTAEKAADLILGNTPLPAEEIDFYRHSA